MRVSKVSTSRFYAWVAEPVSRRHLDDAYSRTRRRHPPCESRQLRRLLDDVDGELREVEPARTRPLRRDLSNRALPPRRRPALRHPRSARTAGAETAATHRDHPLQRVEAAFGRLAGPPLVSNEFDEGSRRRITPRFKPSGRGNDAELRRLHCCGTVLHVGKAELDLGR